MGYELDGVDVVYGQPQEENLTYCAQLKHLRNEGLALKCTHKVHHDIGTTHGLC